MKKSKYGILLIVALCACVVFSFATLMVQVSNKSGTQGAPGATGEQGAAGERGTYWYSDNGVPTEEKTSGAKAGDFYVDMETMNVYVYDGTTWTQNGNLKGNKGDDGSRGTVWFRGTLAPEDNEELKDAQKGDFYFRSFEPSSGYNGYQIYEMTGSGWDLLFESKEELYLNIASEEDLVAALEQNGNCKLVDDIEITENSGVIQHSGTSKIELDGHNLTGGIKNSGSLTISNKSKNDSVIYSALGHSVYNEGDLVIDGNVTVYCNKSISASAIYNAGGGTAAIRGGTFLYNEDTSLTDLAWYVIFNARNATITELKNVTVSGNTHASLVENFGLIEEISNVNLQNSVNVIKNEPSGVIEKISGGTFTMTRGYEDNKGYTNGGAVVLNYGIIEDISDGEFILGNQILATDPDYYNQAQYFPSVVHNYNVLNISGGQFTSQTKESHNIIITNSYNDQALAGQTNISGGIFTVNPDEGVMSYAVYSVGYSTVDGKIHQYAHTTISDGTFSGSVYFYSTTGGKYAGTISGGHFDSEPWHRNNGGSYLLISLAEDSVIVRDGNMFVVVQESELTYTNAESDGYFEAKISTTSKEHYTDYYYRHAGEAILGAFELAGGGYDAVDPTVELYASCSQDVALPVGKTLAVIYAVAGVQYTGNVTAAADSKSPIWKGTTERGLVFEYNALESEATAEIVRNGGEPRYFLTLQDALKKAQSGDVINILKNIELTESVQVTVHNITLNLNGNTITGAKSKRTFDINGARDFVIEDKAGGGAIMTNSTTSSQSPIYLQGDATVTIKSGNYARASMSTTASWLNSTSFTGALTIEGGTFTGTISNMSATTLFIRGGTFTADPSGYNAAGQAILCKEGSFVVLGKNELTYQEPSSPNYYQAKIPTKQPETYGDLYYASAEKAIERIFSLGNGYDKSAAVIELYANCSKGVQLPKYASLTVYYGAGEVEYTGEVSSSNQAFTVEQSSPENGNGKLYKMELNEESKNVSVSHNGKISYYLDLADAFSYAQDGDKIELLMDHDTAKAVLSANDVTLELNGKTVTCSASSTAIEVNGAKNFTIQDSSPAQSGMITTVTKSTSGTLGTIVLKLNATVTITGGTIAGGTTTKNGIESEGNWLGYNNAGTLTITGGKFKGTVSEKANETNLVIKGGYFTANPKDYVAEGFTASEEPDEDGYYTVKSGN